MAWWEPYDEWHEALPEDEKKALAPDWSQVTYIPDAGETERPRVWPTGLPRTI